MDMAIFNVQKGITPVLGNPKSWFLRCAYRLMVHYNCVKFRENISDVSDL